MGQLIYSVPQSHCVLVDRFGKYARTQQAGLRVRVPFLESVHRVLGWGDVANKKGYLIELTEQQTDTAARQCHTKDNVPVTVNASVYWRITDPVKAVYEVDLLPQSVADISLNALRAVVGTLELDEVLSERQRVTDTIASQLSETASKWGIVFTRVEVQDLSTDEKVADAMTQQMEAERGRRGRVAEAEGEAEAKMKVAEAEKKARILRAEGRAKALDLLARAERKYLDHVGGGHRASQLLLAEKYLDGFETISKNPGDKVFVPNSFQGLFSFPLGKQNSGKEEEETASQLQPNMDTEPQESGDNSS